MNTILFRILFFVGTIISLTACKEKIVVADYDVIPQPYNIISVPNGNTEKGADGFLIDKSILIVYPPGNEKLAKNASFLSLYIQAASGFAPEVTDHLPENRRAIILKTEYPAENKDAYQITVHSSLITINGASESGNFYGVQTLRKAMPVDSDEGNILMPGVHIEDFPRFGYRGMHLDIARHFFSLDFIKEYIDILALHNINIFHWHLTDDQGWRIEIEKYPLLTEKGSQRKETLKGFLDDHPQEFDGIPYQGGYFTQDEAREIIAYAADRYIEIIPEIDLPGHMLAALACYPHLGCTGGPYEVATKWGVFEDVLCVGNDSVFIFLEDVLSEIADLFPGKYIHIGGDECPKTRWEVCPKCQDKIKELKLRNDTISSKEAKLQSYCMSRIEEFLKKKGKKIIGWDEILEGGASPEATVMAWRGVEEGKDAAQKHHDAIIVPYTCLYFDYCQGEDPAKEPLCMPGYSSVEKVYNFEPLPSGLNEEEKKHIIGVQANMWSEYLISTDLVEYMLMPRIDALSEIQWSMPENKNYNSFVRRMEKMKQLYDKFGYNYAKHIFED